MFYRQRLDGVTNAATTITLAHTQVLAGDVVRLSHAVVLNSSGESVTAQIGVLEGADFFPLQPKQTVADGDGTAITEEFFIFESQQLAAKITGTVNKKRVTLYASGVVHSPDPPPVAPLIVAEQQSEKLVHG